MDLGCDAALRETETPLPTFVSLAIKKVLEVGVGQTMGPTGESHHSMSLLCFCAGVSKKILLETS